MKFHSYFDSYLTPSILMWYHADGNALSLKETVEAIDEENKSITYNIVDREVLKHYKSLKCSVQVSAKDF